MNGIWNNIERHISIISGTNIQFVNRESLSGGCISDCWKITDSNSNRWFIKTNARSLGEMFIAEAEGLNEIAASNSISCPKALCFGTSKEFSYLVLEYIPLKPLNNQRAAGAQLAKMHQLFSNSFGWKCDNTIGSTPQSNLQNNDWVSFWKNERLLSQLNLAQTKGYPNYAYDEGLKLAENLSSFFTYQPKPSLLHGDLWRGNCASNANGNPVIFDPAVYYGDRETDIAMTELFGGFNNNFYSAYNDAFALDDDYKTRKTLYNLYHILNHFNLFGGAYASQAASMTQQLLSEI